MPKLKDMLDKFNKDKQVINLVEAKSIFEIFKLTETACSGILAWLLDPRESHKLGNKFALELLKQIGNPAKNYCVKTLPKKNGKDTLKIDKELFKNSVVLTEYVINNSRIDLVVIDYENNLCLVIENKYGSKIHDNQLQTYKNYLFDECKDMHKVRFIFVYLDLSDVKNVGKEFDGWEILNYNFVLEFIKKNSKNCLFDDLLKAFEKDLIPFDYVSFFKNVMAIADKYSDVLMKMNDNYKTVSEYLNSSETQLQKYLNATYKNNSYFVDEAKFYLKNKEIFKLYYSKNFQKIFTDFNESIILGKKSVFKTGKIDFTTKTLEDFSNTLWFAYGEITYKNSKYWVRVIVNAKFFKGSYQKYEKIKNIKKKIDMSKSTIAAVKQAVNILLEMSEILK